MPQPQMQMTEIDRDEAAKSGKMPAGSEMMPVVVRRPHKAAINDVSDLGINSTNKTCVDRPLWPMAFAALVLCGLGALVFWATLFVTPSGSVEAWVGLGMGAFMMVSGAVSVVQATGQSKANSSPASHTSGQAAPVSQVAMAAHHARQLDILKSFKTNLVKVHDGQSRLSGQLSDLHEQGFSVLEGRLEEVQTTITKMGSILGDLTRTTREGLALTQERLDAGTIAISKAIATAALSEPSTEAVSALEEVMGEGLSQLNDQMTLIYKRVAEQNDRLYGRVETRQNKAPDPSTAPMDAAQIAQVAQRIADQLNMQLSQSQSETRRLLTTQFVAAAQPLLDDLRALRTSVDAILADQDQTVQNQKRSLQGAAEAGDLPDHLSADLRAAVETALKEHEAIVVGRLSQISIQLAEQRREAALYGAAESYLGAHQTPQPGDAVDLAAESVSGAEPNADLERSQTTSDVLVSNAAAGTAPGTVGETAPSNVRGGTNNNRGDDALTRQLNSLIPPHSRTGGKAALANGPQTQDRVARNLEALRRILPAANISDTGVVDDSNGNSAEDTTQTNPADQPNPNRADEPTQGAIRQSA